MNKLCIFVGMFVVSTAVGLGADALGCSFFTSFLLSGVGALVGVLSPPSPNAEIPAHAAPPASARPATAATATCQAVMGVAVAAAVAAGLMMEMPGGGGGRPIGAVQPARRPS